MVTGTATAAVLVGADELNADGLLGSTEGTATGEVKSKKSDARAKEMTKEQKMQTYQ